MEAGEDDEKKDPANTWNNGANINSATHIGFKNSNLSCLKNL